MKKQELFEKITKMGATEGEFFMLCYMMKASKQSRIKRITNRQIAEISGLFRTTIVHHLSSLVKKGIIISEGANRGSYYEIPWLSSKVKDTGSRVADGLIKKREEKLAKKKRNKKGKK